MGNPGKLCFLGSETCCCFRVCRHPWFSRALPEKYEVALAQLQEEQRAIDARVAGGNYRSKERDAQLQVNKRPVCLQTVSAVDMLASVRRFIVAGAAVQTSTGTIA
jgi:hypothetical protein